MNDMNGKTILITGATNGIGKVAALELAKMGATTVIAGRSPVKTDVTVQEIRAQTTQEGGHPTVEGLVADLSSMAEVRRLADEFRARYSRLDVLINNAGGIFADRQVTVDGYEWTFAFNHLSYFLLTNLLLDMLIASAPSRVVNTSSRAHEGAVLNFDDLQNEKNYGFGGYRAYGQSKLANVMFTYELARRLEGTGVTVNAVHPGAVATGFGVNNGGAMRVAMRVFHQFALTPEQGADTLIYLASSPEVAGVTGKYWTKRQPVPSSRVSYDEAAQKRLWDVSAQLTGLENRVHAS
jgi:NAD(P)-dependent dehydrogenase (short-subunit alcohol dehydrogenase family)